MTNKVTLEQIAQSISEYDSNAVTEIMWGDYLDIWVPSFRYNISFGTAENGWSYNDDQGFGYGDFIDELPTAKEIVEVFFKQVAENPQLTYEKVK